MKKTSIKVFGVCAATLLTLGAVAPVAVHAEEATATNGLIQERAEGNYNLKTEVTLMPSEVVTFNNTNNANNIYLYTNGAQNPTIPSSVAKEKVLADLTGFENLLKDENVTDIKEVFKGLQGTENIFVAYDPKFKDGDSFKVYFYQEKDPENNPGQLNLLTTVLVNVSFDGQNDFSATANNINAQVGDLYNPAQGITVRNTKNDTVINNAVLLTTKTNENGKEILYFLNRFGNYEKLSTFGLGISKETFESTIKKEAPKSDNNISNIEDQMRNHFGWKPGTYYFILDNSNFATTERIDENINVENGMETKVYTYGSDVVDFRQNLEILVIPTGDAKSEPLFVNRLINVTGETPEETKVPVYRAYNPNNGDHLFTTSLKEYNEVVDKGWAPEGLAWNAATEEDGTNPVYRLYNPNSGEHFYTDSEKEYNEVAAAGWNKEGIAFYSASSEDGVKIFRSFNPNATGPGSHMFTDSEKEYNELTAAGWSPEGVAFYGIK